MTAETDNQSKDIDHQQPPSGIWKKNISSKVPSIWQRFWIVTGIVYLLMLVPTYFVVIPDQMSIEMNMVLEVMDEVKRYDGMAFAGESPQQVMVSVHAQGYEKWIGATRIKFHIGHEGDAGFAKTDKDYRKAISDLPVKRVIGILICVVVWSIPMGLLYAVGFAVEWVLHGTKSQVEKSH